jgi:AcrR family transcriptional regulator
MPKAEKAPSSAGRPSGRAPEQVRGALLQAAREHFLERDFKAVSLRQIADSAGVNGAMVSYYFGSKQGLYLAMVDELLAVLASDLISLGEQENLTVVDFIRSYSKLLHANPWWPNFLIREVMFSEGEVREAVLDRFARVFAPQLLANIQREINLGHYREDLDSRLCLLSLMGLTVFPFLVGPVLKQVVGMELDASLVAKLAEHNCQLFLHGVTTTP